MALADQIMPMLSLGLGAQPGQPAPVQNIGAMTAQQQGGLTPFYDPNQLAQLQVDQQDYQRRNQLANQLMSTGYVPNSGKFGMLAGIASMLGGKFAQSQNDQKLSDIVARQIQAEQQAAQAQHAQKLADQTFTTNEDIRKATATAGKEFIPGVGYMDKMTGEITQNPGVAATEIATKKAEAQNAAQATAMYREAPGAADMAKLGAINKIMGMPQSPQRDAMLASLVPADAFASLTGGTTAKDKAAVDKRIPTLQDQVGKIDTALDIANSMKAQLAAGGYPSTRVGGAIESYLPTQAQTSGAQQLTGDSNALLAAAQAALQGAGNRGSMLQLKVLGASKPNLANSPETNAHLIDTIVGTLNKARQDPAAELEHYGNGGTPTSWASISAKNAATRAPSSPAGTLPPLSGSGPGIPQGAVARLKANPSEAPLFDQQFGQGAAASVLGQ